MPPYVCWQATEESRRKKVVSTAERGGLKDLSVKDLGAEMSYNLKQLLEDGREIG